MLRLRLFLIIGYLVFRGIRSLMPARQIDRDAADESVADLRACAGCGTFVERRHLDDALRCSRCRDADRDA